MTGEGKEPQRPNANYRLSRPEGTENPTGEEGLHFHYNRERRLAKAPQAVKDLYTVKKKPSRFSLIGALVSTKPTAMLFFTIAILCAAMIVLSLVGFFDSSYLLDGNKLNIRGTRYEGTVIMVIRKTIKKGAGYSGAVDIAVAPLAAPLVAPLAAAAEDYPVFYHRIFFSAEADEEYRFAVPLDPPELALVLQTEKSTLKIKLKPE
jgi:hypothetical protein